MIQSDCLVGTMSENEAGMLAPDIQVLCFRVQEAQYAIDVCFVNSVLLLMELQQVPGSNGYLAGIMNYMGKSVAVIDFGIWLGLNNAETYQLSAPVIICSDGKDQVALVVDEVLQIESIDQKTIQMNSLFKEGDSAFNASLSLKSGMTLLLDMPYILRNVSFRSRE